jgi:hypothetical protein
VKSMLLLWLFHKDWLLLYFCCFHSFPSQLFAYRLCTVKCSLSWRRNAMLLGDFLVKTICCFSWIGSSPYVMLVSDVVAMLITCSGTNCCTGHKLYIHK